MLRRLHTEQPDSFAFTKGNAEWAKTQIAKYPDGRQASAVISLLWRAQEQEGWLTRPAIEAVAGMLGMDYIRALEVATFYFMFQLRPVGSVAHVQVCGTTTCMICGAEDLIGVCREKIAAQPHEMSPDGKFSWEEVECLGACTNAPMVQIGKDFYEDLTAEQFADILDAFGRGEVPVPGPQNGRYAAEPLSGLTSLKEFESGRTKYNASASRAVEFGDTVARVTSGGGAVRPVARATEATEGDDAAKPAMAAKPAAGEADDLKRISGVGPALEKLLNDMGVFHFEQIAKWTDAEVSWVDQNLLRFKGRASRDNWVKQAKLLGIGEETDISTSKPKGNVTS